jgi:hypothetical protein
VVARDGTGRKVARSVASCAECLAWGLTYCQGVCLACYNFAARYRGHVGGCAACGRRLPLRDGYCRLCWCQARRDRAGAAADARSAVVLAPWLARVRYHQLFFAGMDSRRAAPRALPRRHGAKGRPLKPPPPVVIRPAAVGIQLTLFDPAARDYRQARFDLRRDEPPANQWLAWALHLAHLAGEARGWQPDTRRGMQRVLVTLLAGHRDGEAVAASAVRAVAVRHSISSQAAIQILATMGIVSEDRPDLFSSWLDARLAGLSPGIAREVRRWATALHDGGPRTRARSPHTARAYPRAALPALRDWSARYDHLREVTREDVLGYVASLSGHERRLAVAALRSLFTWAKKAGVVFRNPATRIRLGKRDWVVWQPLSGQQLSDAAAAAATPQARLCLVLAAVHAARPGMIRALQLDDADLESGRLRLAGTDRPMGELTATVLREWLEYRRHRWPHTANPHLLVSRESALRHGPVSAAYITSLRGLPATLERLRIDCQLAEAMATGFDPLHLASVFGISADTAIRYAVNARQLLGPAHQAAPPSPPTTPRSEPGGRRALTGGSAVTRVLAISRYRRDRSMPMPQRPSWRAARSVVPAPANGSRTVPPSGHPARMQRRASSPGKVAKWAPRNEPAGMAHTLPGFAPAGCVICSRRKVCGPLMPWFGSPFREDRPGSARCGWTRRSDASACGCRIASRSNQYLADRVSRNTSSYREDGRSRADSGVQLSLCQTIADRSHHPSAWRASATRHGMPSRSLGLAHSWPGWSSGLSHPRRAACLGSVDRGPGTRPL